MLYMGLNGQGALGAGYGGAATPAAAGEAARGALGEALGESQPGDRLRQSARGPTKDLARAGLHHGQSGLEFGGGGIRGADRHSLKSAQ